MSTEQSLSIRRLVSEAQIPLFRALDDAELAMLLGEERIDTFEPGETILAQGDHRDEMFIILDGLVRITLRDAHNVERAIAEVGPGGPVGEMSLLTGEPASATVTALSNCRLLVVSRRTFQATIEQSVTLSRNIGAILSERLRVANRRTLADAERAFVPIYATAARWETAQILALNLAVSIAWHTGGRVLLINFTSAERPSALSQMRGKLPALAELIANPALLREHERPVDANGELCGLRVIEDDLDATEGLVNAADGLLTSLTAVYDYVVAALPVERPLALAGTLKEARRLLALPDEDGGGESLRRVADAALTTEEGSGMVRLIVAEGYSSAPTQEQIAALQARFDGLPVQVVPGLRQAAAHEGALFAHRRELPAAQAIGWLARDIAGMKVGVALGSGSLKGYAHIALLERLQAAGVPVDYLAGCSIGAIIGALWSIGYGPAEIVRLMDESAKHIFRPTLPVRSFLSNDRLARFIRGVGAGRRFEDAYIPLAIVAVDLLARREAVFRRGPLWRAIMASMSIPGIFPPVHLGESYLVDGGILNPVPTNIAASLGADIVIGVKLVRPPDKNPITDPSPRRPRRSAPTIIDTLLRATEIMQGKITDEAAARSTIIIEPKWPSGVNIGLREFARGREFLPSGLEAAEAALPRLRTVLPWLNRT